MAEKTYNQPTQKPTGKVKSMSISRTKGTRTIVIKWKVPSALRSKKGSDGKKRTTSLDELFKLMSGKTEIATKYKDQASESDTEFSVNLNSFTPSRMGGNAIGSKLGDMINSAILHRDGKIKRTDFYPCTGIKLTSVIGSVRCKNTHGAAGWSNKTYTFSKPGAPTISDITQTKEEGYILFTITAYDDKSGQSERYDTQYEISVYDSRDNSTTPYNGSFTGSSRSWTDNPQSDYKIDIADRFHLTYEQYVRITVKARSRGFAGDSGWRTKTTSSADAYLVVGYPSQVSLGTPIIPGTSASDKVTIPITTNEVKDKHPVTGVRLQTLVNVTYDKASRIPGTAEWQDTDIIDNGQCTALAINASEVIPDAGRHTWVRVKSWNQFEDMFYRYSEPKLLVALEANLPTGEDDEMAILQAISGDDGKSVELTLGWNIDGEDDSTGTEVSWSQNVNAWRSTSGPHTHEFSWSDGQIVWPPEGQELAPGQQRTTYHDSAVIHVDDNIEEGKLHHFRARRYMEGEDNTTYGPYSSTADVMPVSSPSSVVLSCAPYVPTGSDLPVSWTYDSDATQTEWQLITGTPTEVTEHIDDGTPEGIDVTHLWILSGTERIVMRGTDASGSCLVTASRLAEFADADGVVPLAVRMGTGGRLTDSEAVLVSIVEPPSIAVTVPETLTVQPLVVSLSSPTTPNVSIVVSAGAGGSGGDTPVGVSDQLEGDTVWSDAISPIWVGPAGAHTYEVKLPISWDIHDGGNYVVTARATDPVTGLSSGEVTTTFAVDWETKALAPSDDIEVEPYDTVAESGFRTRGARIHLVPPEDAADTDRYDVYRVTPNGPYLVAEGVALDTVVDDRFAPYGGSEKGYRVACWTLDGDMEWANYSYELDGKDIRIDFDGEYVELPWNVSTSDGFEKDFEARRKLDGSIDGYWNDGATRTASLSTDLIRIADAEKEAAVMRLAEYSGPCFVRTPNGSAFMANVTVDSVGGQRRDAAIGVSLDATEVGLTSEYMATLPDPEPTDDGQGG